MTEYTRHEGIYFVSDETDSVCQKLAEHQPSGEHANRFTSNTEWWVESFAPRPFHGSTPTAAFSMLVQQTHQVWSMVTQRVSLKEITVLFGRNKEEHIRLILEIEGAKWLWRVRNETIHTSLQNYFIHCLSSKLKRLHKLENRTINYPDLTILSLQIKLLLSETLDKPTRS